MAAKGFIKLLEYSERARQRALGLPSQGEVIEYWSGIGFTLLGQRYVATMGEVAEVLSVPRYTSVPGVKPWMKGLANVRGRLLPVMDLLVFFNHRSGLSEQRRRVLVVDQNDIFSGLVVDEVLGMQHFPVFDYQEETQSDVVAELRPYLQGAFLHNGQYWNVFSLTQLLEDPRFLQPSAA